MVCPIKSKTFIFGQIIRWSKYELLQLILQGLIEGRRGMRGKQMSCLRNIHMWTGLRTIVQLVHTFKNIVSNI